MRGLGTQRGFSRALVCWGTRHQPLLKPCTSFPFSLGMARPRPCAPQPPLFALTPRPLGMGPGMRVADVSVSLLQDWHSLVPRQLSLCWALRQAASLRGPRLPR